jgi:hypothetical protein
MELERIAGDYSVKSSPPSVAITFSVDGDYRYFRRGVMPTGSNIFA